MDSSAIIGMKNSDEKLKLVPVEGIEPPLTDSQSVRLPLADTGIS